jgi:hypothetical protein
MWRLLLTLEAGAVLVAALGGCTEKNPCDSTSRYVDRTCRALASDAAVADAAAGDAPSADRDLTGPVNFGATCRDHSECMGAQSACLVQPGQMSGFCSAVECDKTPGICPTDWSCCDLSKFSPGAPWGCVPLAGCP